VCSQLNDHNIFHHFARYLGGHITQKRIILKTRKEMSGKYAFSQTLKEVRFLFCQTGEKSAGARFVVLHSHSIPTKDYLKV
jgi:hypothetical protein